MKPHDDNNQLPDVNKSATMCSATVPPRMNPGATGSLMNTLFNGNVLNRALDYVRGQLVDGVRHGFFEFTITCEIVKDRKRRLVVKAGKSEQFTIPAEEVER
jgi:hypothetical protein